jgi:hypothetical protein
MSTYSKFIRMLCCLVVMGLFAFAPSCSSTKELSQKEAEKTWQAEDDAFGNPIVLPASIYQSAKNKALWGGLGGVP